MPCVRTWAIRSSSMQPPETEPTTRPSSQMASVAPIGRGLEPQVLMTVTSSQRWPAVIQSALVQYFEVYAVHAVLLRASAAKCRVGCRAMEYTMAPQSLQEADMSKEIKTVKKADDGTPKFGRLLVVLVLCVLFCVFMTWMMAEVFPDFPNFG